MADISKIKPLGSNTTYNIKDNSAIASITRNGTTFTATRRDGTTFTFNQDKYVHPTTTAVAAAAVKVGKDSTGHVVIGSALTKSDVGLSNVENTKLSTWTGTNNITTLGTITTGTWNGDIIDIAHGGTGATTTAAARTNLGLGSFAVKNSLNWNEITQSGADLLPEGNVDDITDNTEFFTSYASNNGFSDTHDSGPGKVYRRDAIKIYNYIKTKAAASGSGFNISGTATNATQLISNNRMDYGWNGINYFNILTSNQSAAKVNDTPFSSNVWTHILRFNRIDPNGYYTDLAIPFEQNSIYYKRIAAGSLQNSTTNGGWIKVLDQLNYTSYTVTKTGSGASGTWNINISGNAATATVASKLSNNSKIGDTNKPVYFKADGTPATINYTIDKSVPSNAVFTDTLVKQIEKADNIEYKILTTSSASPTSGNAAEAAYDTGVTINPSIHRLSAAQMQAPAGLYSYTTSIVNLSGYIKFATLTVTAGYFNRGIQISYASRNNTGGIIYCIFSNINNKDPDLTITKTGPAEIYYKKSDTSTWDLYISKTESYDQEIFSIINPGQLGVISNPSDAITWKSEHVAELPEGYLTAAVHTIKLNIIGTATTASKLSNTSKIGDTNKPVYFTAGGIPSAISYTIDKSVPSNAIFTDRYVNSATFVDDSTNTAASPVKMTLTRAGSDTVTVTANIPKVSSSSAGVAPKGASVSSQSQSTKFLREDGTWAAPSYTVNTNTDTLVKQTAKSDNKNYKILFTTSDSPTSGNANEAAYDTGITINPSTHTLTAAKFIGSLQGNAATATTASKLSNTSAIGSSTQPVYFNSSGQPVAVNKYKKTGKTKDFVPYVGSGGVMEIGKYIDFHNTSEDTSDYIVRITARDSSETNGAGLTLTGTTVGTFKGNLNGTATKATQDGNGNVITSTYLPLSGGTMTGNLQWNGLTALPSTTTTDYFLAIDAFANGGTTKYITKGDALKSLISSSSIGTSLRPVYWTGSSFSQVNWFPSYCTVDGHNKNNYNYHRIATLSIGGSTWTDRDAVLVIRSRYNTSNYGIVKISGRATNNQGLLDLSAYWLIRSGFEEDSILICRKRETTDTSLGDTQVDVYLKTPIAYPRIYVYMLVGPSHLDGFQLINSEEKDNSVLSYKTSDAENPNVIDINNSDLKGSYEVYIRDKDENGNLLNSFSGYNPNNSNSQTTPTAQSQVYTHIKTALDAGSVSRAKKSSLISTNQNAIAYYTDTTGTFGQKASANGALYATSVNGSLQWGTLPMAQGGTGATTAAGARTNLGLGTMATEAANNYIAKSIGTAKGDIIYWSAANTPARLNIGSVEQVLKVSSNGIPAWSDTLGFIKINNEIKIKGYGDNNNYWHTIKDLTTAPLTNDRWHYLPNISGWIVTSATNGTGNSTTPIYIDEGGLTRAITGTISNNTTGNADTATEFSSNTTVKLTGDATGESAGSKKGWSVPVTLANSGVAAGSYGPSANAEPGYGATFNVPYITVDAKGRVTSASTKTIKIPASDEQDHRDEGYGKITPAGDTGTSAVTANTTQITAKSYNEGFTFKTGNKWLTIAGTESGTTGSDILTIGHKAGLTAKNSYGSTATTASANNGTIKVTDVQYDEAGHITASTDRTITLSQVKNTAGATNSTAKLFLIGAATQGENPQTYSNNGIYIGNNNKQIVIESTSDASIKIRKFNESDNTDVATISMYVDSSGQKGLYDDKNQKWIFANSSDGTNSFISSNLRPSQTNAYSLGSTDRYWNNIYVKDFFTKEATESGTTYRTLMIGNETNRIGRISLYSGSKGGYIQQAINNTNNWILHQLPAESGWIVKAGNGTSTGTGDTETPIYVDTRGVAKPVNALPVNQNLLTNTQYYFNNNTSTKPIKKISTQDIPMPDCYSKYDIASSTSVTNLSLGTFAPAPDTWYTLSFYARANYNNTTIRTHFYPDTTASSYNCQGFSTTANDGTSNFTVSTEWKRYWVCYKTSASVSGTKNLIARLISGTSPGTTLRVALPKLEVGQIMTPWVPHANDFSQNKISTCYIDNHELNNYQWHRIATCSVGTKNYDDRDIILFVHKGYLANTFGILKISVRVENNAASPPIKLQTKWLLRHGFSESDCLIGLTRNSIDANSTATADIYFKTSTSYARIAFTVLNNFNKGFTLFNSDEIVKIENGVKITDLANSTEVYIKENIMNGTTIESIKFKSDASSDTGITYVSWEYASDSLSEKSLIPIANNTYDLGSSSLKWNNIYAKNSYLSGTTDSNYSNDSTAAFRVAGGASIAKKLSTKELQIDNNNNTKKVLLQYNDTLETLNFVFM